MPSLYYLVDSLCANFTVESIYDLVVAIVAEVRPCHIGIIAGMIAERDHSLDIKSAQSLAEAAVNGLVQRGDLAVRGPHIHLANPVPE
ncbi:MAG: hypothetical protein HYX99_03190 [Chloroflexi bacterium]|nr:hypothetical protein [Chloroflexota bacterium]